MITTRAPRPEKDSPAYAAGASPVAVSRGKPEIRACANPACGRVGDDVVVFDVSNVCSTTRRSLCPRCVAGVRADPLLIVELVVDDELDERLARAAAFFLELEP